MLWDELVVLLPLASSESAQVRCRHCRLEITHRSDLAWDRHGHRSCEASQSSRPSSSRSLRVGHRNINIRTCYHFRLIHPDNVHVFLVVLEFRD
ncbi:hypothetical protein B0H65DRAFT_178805 [Neurospora tetraspora]|uniref:Uncharacterized protein n=1 Tax=Neurospora tetraspora TaxID=94610 RepID=A0AAE0JJB9_9PEZI|nr:hypothetical protein B0H65DRAFT_178805 [Neurospora tetraspora]